MDAPPDQSDPKELRELTAVIVGGMMANPSMTFTTSITESEILNITAIALRMAKAIVKKTE